MRSVHPCDSEALADTEIAPGRGAPFAFILGLNSFGVIQQTFFLGGTVPMNLNPNLILQSIAGAAMAIAMMAGAQTPPTPAPAPPPAATPAPAPAPADQTAAPAPPSTFVVTGPLQWLPPATFDAGPLGKLSVNGIVTGFAQFQNNSVPGDDN